MWIPSFQHLRIWCHLGVRCNELKWSHTGVVWAPNPIRQVSIRQRNKHRENAKCPWRQRSGDTHANQRPPKMSANPQRQEKAQDRFTLIPLRRSQAHWHHLRHSCLQNDGTVHFWCLRASVSGTLLGNPRKLIPWFPFKEWSLEREKKMRERNGETRQTLYQLDDWGWHQQCWVALAVWPLICYAWKGMLPLWLSSQKIHNPSLIMRKITDESQWGTSAKYLTRTPTMCHQNQRQSKGLPQARGA